MLDGSTGSLLLWALIGLMGVLVVAAAVGFRSFLAQWITRHYLAQGLQQLKDRRNTEALESMLKAEARWQINLHNGSRSSLLRDVDQYSAIASAIFQVLLVKSGPVWDDVNATLTQMKTLLHDRANFGIDGRTMKTDVAPRWQGLCERIELLRPKLRSLGEITFPN